MTTASLETIEQRAHSLATRVPVPEMVTDLQRLFGQKYVALLANVASTRMVGPWTRGERTPHAHALAQLRTAYLVMQMLLQVDDADTVRSWFVGMNPLLDDESPGDVLAADPKRVIRAARVFLAEG